jgi:hypothetical protein
MKKLILLTSLVLSACGGSLSDDQRKKLHEGMEQQKIVQLSDSEITSVALDHGKLIVGIVGKFQANEKKMDSVASQYHAKIRWSVPGASPGRDIEQQLIDAYVMGMATGSLQDNIQKLHTGTRPEDYDSLLYSKPVVTVMPDGVEKLEGIWNIYLSKKQIVLLAAKK